MEFKQAYLRLNEQVTLNKGDIRVINKLLSSVKLIDDVNKEIMREIMAEDTEGIEVGEYEGHIQESKTPFFTSDITRNGKVIASIYLNYRQEVEAVK